ncbi:uncharacterized protein LOC131313247 isoform X1 [Rhododendron vialii]|uniref:uncharacterized protein LOC131313247 isoform X1 n=1 Tax=Rhododendron vialii TaxID=182163 RepID=UPI00265F9239|nr:uncharacterized protein LOC131313247 isoform X1 [Rhododendron vialii]
MEYERIHKVQTGIISPSKLRMKLMGHQSQKKKEGSNSSRTSPSKLEDSEFAKNSLLATKSGDFDEEVSSSEVSSVKLSSNAMPEAGQADLSTFQPKENTKLQQFSKSDNGNSSSVHPVRSLDEENLDYDSNASSSSFEFHKGERTLQNPLTRSLSRNMPSKWNDAEKWIMNKQNVQNSYSKKSHMQSQVNKLPVTNTVRVAPESGGYDQKLAVKRVDFCQPTSQFGMEKFSFVPSASHPIHGQASGANVGVDLCPESKDLKEVDNEDSSCTKSTSTEDATGVPAIRSVCMRDMGTEMTPIPSQEPSRTATPVGSTTPFRSPTSSIPSTPRRGAPASTPTGQTTDDECQDPTKKSKRGLSEEELKLKTRREIVALGVQLGKMNIAAWASKDEKEKNAHGDEMDVAMREQIEIEKRAAAWEEAEKSKHTARYKREEIKIQAWESRQKAKLEAEMRRIEAQVEQMRANAQAKMVKKIAMARQISEEKRAAAEAKRDQSARKTAAQAEYIRQTGRIPSAPFICCGWLL